MSNILRYISNVYIFPNWWELKDKKGLESVGEYLETLTGFRFSIYRDFGGSICEDKNKSYYYAYFYFEGFRLWLPLSENRQPFKMLKTITYNKYLKVKAQYEIKKQKMGQLHEEIGALLESENLRDLLGEYDYERGIYKLGD